jgi:hydroxymethylbilane synthase
MQRRFSRSAPEMGITRTLRLGTRSSLLARAQSLLVADELVLKNPGLNVQLINLETRGDRDLSTPLAAVNDPHFFSAELDHSLLGGEVDFCVHSWKDIDGVRPAGIVRAAVPRRELPHDVILFRADIAQRIRDGANLKIGTSSVRRRVNIGDCLRWALPAGSGEVVFHELRGAVEKRLERIAGSAGNERLDGVVLALAGLERLWQNPEGRAAISSLLDQARWMVLPLGECPAAPAQAALALECRATDTDCINILRSIHHPRSEDLVQLEQRMALNLNNPDTCGTTAIDVPELGYVVRSRYRSGTGPKSVSCQTAVEHQPDKPLLARAWFADHWRRHIRLSRLTAKPEAKGPLFVAHADALAVCSDYTPAPDSRVWTSGVASWKRLAAQGIWVEGCAENFGFAAIRTLLSTGVLQLPALQHWTALTHADALDSWQKSGVGEVVATYAIDSSAATDKVASELAGCTHFYWSSARQYLQLRKHVPDNAHHACGPGKTLHALRTAGLTNAQPFASRQDWKQWLN